MLKVFGLMMIVCASSFIGVAVGDFFRKREKFFFDLHTFVYALQLDIEFFEKKLKKIVAEKADRYGKEFMLVLKHFEQFLLSSNETFNDSDLFAGIWMLSKEEKTFISNFFFSLGRSGSRSQVANLEQFKAHYYSVYQLCKTEASKYGNLAIKLGILLGLVIAILLI